MTSGFHFSYIPSFYFWVLVVALFRSCLSNTNSNTMLCIDDERQALLEFKHSLINGADLLTSWVSVDKDCCRWAGIVCDNATGHIHGVHLPGLGGHCHDDYNTRQEYNELSKLRLRGDLSSSLLHLKQLRHLDLSCNDFGRIQVPSFIGSLGNLRYLNLSCSNFGGTIPPQLGNLTEMRILSLGSFYSATNEFELTSIRNMQWLSSLRLLRHLDMSGMDLSKAIDWFQCDPDSDDLGSAIDSYRRLYTDKNGNFVQDEPGRRYAEMVALRDAQRGVEEPLSEDEIMKQVLGPRSGWERGIGPKLSSSSQPPFQTQGSQRFFSQAEVEEMINTRLAEQEKKQQQQQREWQQQMQREMQAY